MRKGLHEQPSRRDFLKATGSLLAVASLWALGTTPTEGGTANPEVLPPCPLTEFSPHFQVKNETGQWVELPTTAQVDSIVLRNQKAVIKLSNGANHFYLNPLAINSRYSGESPLKRLQRLVTEYNIPHGEINNLTNKELLTKVRTKLQSDQPETITGYVYDITPNQEAIIFTNQRISTDFFEDAELYPQLLKLPLSLLQEFNPDQAETESPIPSFGQNYEESEQDDEVRLLDMLRQELGQYSDAEASPSVTWNTEVGYLFHAETLRGSTDAESIANIMKYSRENGGNGSFIVQTLRSLGIPLGSEVQSVSLRNTFIINGTVYLTGISFNGSTDVIYKVQQNAVEQIMNFQRFTNEGRRVVGAFPIPQNDRYWVVSFVQSSGIPNSLVLIDTQQPNSNGRLLRFANPSGGLWPDLYCLYPKLSALSTHAGKFAEVTRYGFGDVPPPPSGREDEGGGSYAIDLESLNRLISQGGNADIVLPAVRYTDISHSFGLEDPDKVFDHTITMTLPPAPKRTRISLPLILKGFLGTTFPSRYKALNWHKDNNVHQASFSIPPTPNIDKEIFGHTTGWDPHLLSMKMDVGNETITMVAQTFPRTYVPSRPQACVMGLVLIEYSLRRESFSYQVIR